MDLSLQNKVILVTGSTSGIGLGIAQALHSEGCVVVVNGRDSIKLQKIITMLPGSLGIVADVTKPHECTTLIDSIIVNSEILTVSFL